MENLPFIEPKREAPGPHLARRSNFALRWLEARFRLTGRARQREHDAALEAQRCGREIAAKFQRLDTRQQRRYAAFTAAYAKAAEKLAIPRRARRKVARVWAKQELKGEQAA